MVVSHALFADDETYGGLCRPVLFFPLPLPLHEFLVFPARSSFDFRHRPFDPPSSAFSASRCPIFPPNLLPRLE